MTRQLVSLALGACLLAALPAADAAAVELPVRKAGLWEMKTMRAGDHQAVQKMYVVRVDKGKFNIIGEVPGDQAIGPITCTRW